jgi:septal ring factor EnvC (AmiA/AmiB activator)
MGAGTVAAVGECAYLGKYMVIDHGYGLRTWYTALGDISVNVGDSVDKGTVIAKSGIGGISPDGTMLVMITLDEIPVSPYAFWEESRSFAR